MHELTLENSYLERLAVVALHERHRPQHRRTQPQLADVFLNFPLALPMVDAGVPLCSSNGAVYEVLDPSLLGGLREILPLHHFALRSDRPEVLHTVDAIRTS